jgi:uncharacterized protein
MKKLWSGVLILSLCLLFFSLTANASSLPRRITFATNPAGTTHHAVATALSTVASKNSQMLVVVTPTAGASAWIDTMNNTGTPEMGSINVFDAWWVHTGKLYVKPIPGNPYGTEPFYKPHPNLRVLIASSGPGYGKVVRNDSDMKFTRDLKGKRVAGGFKANRGALASTLAGLDNGGLTTQDVREVMFTNPAEAVRGLMEGRIDATNAALGMAALQEADAMINIRFLQYDDSYEAQQRIGVYTPGASIQVLQPGPAGIKEPTRMAVIPNVVMVPSNLSAEVVRELLGIWTEKWEEVQALHPAFKDWSKSQFVLPTVTVPYHEAAVAFFKGKGMWNKDMDRIQESLLKGETPFIK